MSTPLQNIILKTDSSPRNAAPREDFGTMPRDGAKPSGRGDIKALTALRFFGVFWVVIDHSQGAFPWLEQSCETVALCQAVTFFFVLSGFVLTYRYINLEGTRRIAAFLIGRLARLWPIHLVGILLLIFMMPGTFKPTRELMPILATNVALLQSAIPITKYFYSYNAPSWSSSTLLFLYFVFPVLLLLIRKSWLLLMLATTCGIASALTVAAAFEVPEFSPNEVSTLGLLYVSPLSRLFDFSLGMCAATAFRKYLKDKSLSLVAGTLLELGAIATLLFIACNSFKWRYLCLDLVGAHGSYWLQNCGFALIGCLILVTVFSMEQGLISKIFRTKIFSFLGEISFCIYVLHTIFLVYGEVVLTMDESINTFCSYLITLFLAATALWLLVEKPSRKLTRDFCQNFVYARSPQKAD
ncbi:MAG: acyltransferase [Candidatus Obscuribacterales bacterium]|nr:acyltransferase [Candidatus Obscuribacterales bacterium]